MKELQIDIQPWTDEIEYKKVYMSPNSENKRRKSRQYQVDEFVHSKKVFFADFTHKTGKYLQVEKKRKNTKEYHSYKNWNYQPLFNEDKDNFIPINGKTQTISYFYQKPTVNTTYITYIQPKSAIYGHTKTFSQTKSRPSSVSLMTNTPKGRVFTHASSSRCNYENEDKIEHLNINHEKHRSYHLQKMLKIKEKLRQKNKKKSDKKQEDRNLRLSQGKTKTKMNQNMSTLRPIKNKNDLQIEGGSIRK